MHFRLSKAALFLAAKITFVAGAAQAQVDCQQVTALTCPSLFTQECRNKEFQEANVEACFEILTGDTQDQEFCAEPAAAQCKVSEECQDLDDPVKRHFCVAGQSECTTNIPGLLDEYNVILLGLDASLSEFSDLTNLNLDEKTSIDILCQTPLERLDQLRERAALELTSFEGSEDSINRIDQCSSTMQSFIDGGAPTDLPADLWDQIARRLIDGLGEIQSKQGEIQTNIEALTEAPKKLKSLSLAYGLICPEETAE